MKRHISLLLVLVMMLGLLAGCGQEKPETSDSEAEIDTSGSVGKTDFVIDESKTYQKKVIISVASPMTNPDPQFIFDDTHNTLDNFVYNQLVAYNFETKELEPELAVEWKAEDAQNYWFKLRDDVTFSNGNPLTAEDVRYTFIDRVAVTGGTAQTAVFPTIEDVEVLGDYELRVKLNKPDADFLNRMYIQNFAICDAESCEADPENGFKIGTGGWIMKEYIASDHATYTKYEDSWVWKEAGFTTPTEEIEVRYMGESATRAAALEAGDIACDSIVGMADYETLKANSNVECTLFAGEVLDYLIFNMKNGITADDENLRLAISYALNIPEINEFAQNGLATRAYTLWGMNQYGYYDEFDEKLEFNLDKAKEYLAKSNHPNGCDLQIYVTNNYESIATLLQAQLKEIGVNVIVNVTDKAGLTEVVKEGKHDAVFMTISLQGIGDRFHFVCNPKSSTNRALYENPEMLAKFDAALAETDDAARKEIYKEIQIELNDVKPYVPFYYEVMVVANTVKTSGIKWSADKKPDYTFIFVEE